MIITPSEIDSLWDLQNILAVDTDVPDTSPPDKNIPDTDVPDPTKGPDLPPGQPPN